MKYSFSLIALAAISSTTTALSAFSNSAELFVRSFDDDYSTLSVRDTLDYDDESAFLIQQTRRSLEARFEHADALAEEHLAVREEAHWLLSRAALAFPEAFALPKGFKVPADPAACAAKRAEVTAQYKGDETSYGTKKAAYPKGGDLAKAQELLDLASKVATGRARAKKLVIGEGCTPDSGHDNEINTWENNKTQWSNEVRNQKNKKKA